MQRYKSGNTGGVADSRPPFVPLSLTPDNWPHRRGGGTVVIHTPGHICLYVKPAEVLIAGDALNVGEGKLIGPRPQYTADMDTALRSLQKLTHYDIETMICYHGGAYRGDANERIADLAKGQGER